MEQIKTKDGKIFQAGIFIFDEKSGALVSTAKLSDDKVSTFLSQKFGDKFVLGGATVKTRQRNQLWIYFFEVVP